MTPELRKMVIDRDDAGLERAYFDDTCPNFFAVDWRGDDADLVATCAECLKLESLTAEWRDDDLYVILDGREVSPPLELDVADRHITVCALNDMLSPNYEIRFLVFTHGNDTFGFAALSVADWRDLEDANPEAVAENFIDPRTLPNLVTELTDEKLPAKARARFARMLERKRRK